MSRGHLRVSILVMALCCSVNSFGAGKITKIWFSGPDDPNHPNVVQLQIEGGFNVTGCDQTYAAIRTGEDREHMISFALAAYVSGAPVEVVLNENDKYFGSNRCTVSRISNS